MEQNEQLRSSLSYQASMLQNDIRILNSKINEVEKEKAEYEKMQAQLGRANMKVSRSSIDVRIASGNLAKNYRSPESDKKINIIEEENENLMNINKGIEKAIELCKEKIKEKEAEILELKQTRAQKYISLDSVQARLSSL